MLLGESLYIGAARRYADQRKDRRFRSSGSRRLPCGPGPNRDHGVVAGRQRTASLKPVNGCEEPASSDRWNVPEVIVLPPFC